MRAWIGDICPREVLENEVLRAQLRLEIIHLCGCDPPGSGFLQHHPSEQAAERARWGDQDWGFWGQMEP